LLRIWISSFALAAIAACLSTEQATHAQEPEGEVYQPCENSDELQTALKALEPAENTVQTAHIDRPFISTLVECLGSPDPVLRDKVGYEGLSLLLRSELVNDPLKHDIRLKLLANMDPETPDPDGVLKPFSVLVLAEIIRADRVSPYMSDAERSEALDAGIRYLYQLNDYRDYDDREGWRHGVAHGADLLLQAVLNPAYDREAHLMIVETAFVKARALNHGYTAGEGERLARPILYAANAGKITQEEWGLLFGDFMSPSPMLEWSDAYRSRGGLNRLHNAKLLLHTLHFTASRQTGETFELLANLTEQALIDLP